MMVVKVDILVSVEAQYYSDGQRKGRWYLFTCMRRETEMCVLAIARAAAMHKVIDRP